MNLLPFFGFLILFGKVAWDYARTPGQTFGGSLLAAGVAVLASALCAILLKLVSGWMGY